MNLMFKEVTIALAEYTPEVVVHMNFVAESEDGVTHLLFAELKSDPHENDWHKFLEQIKNQSSNDFHVTGCCSLKKGDLGIPLGRTCGLCGYMVDHPGSAYGSIIVAGDPYKDYHFYDYKSDMSRRMRKPFIPTRSPSPSLLVFLGSGPYDLYRNLYLYKLCTSNMQRNNNE
ncbi:unnamed protein product [Amaranthus hypochondriacus]